MTDEMHRKIASAMENVFMVTLAIKATGGYKHKLRLGLSDKDATALMEKGEAKVLRTVIALLVAEDFIDKQTGRLHIYHEMVSDAMKWIGSHQKEISEMIGSPLPEVEAISRD